MGDIAQRGNRLTFAKGGRAGFQKGRRVGHKRTGNTQRENRLEELGRVDAEKAWTRHGKRDLKLEKHRIRSELKKGGKPWGTGPKPGTHEFLEHHLHKPRKGKAVGGAVKIGKRFLDFIKTGKHVDKKGVKTNVPKAAERLTGKPHVDRVKKAAGGWTQVIPKKLKKLDFPGDRKGKPHSSREGRKDSWVRGARRALDSAKKITEKMRPKKPGPQAPSRPKKTWPPKYSDLLMRYPKMPQPHKSPGDIKYIPKPKYTPGEPKIMQPAATGGRIGLKKGGSDKKWIQKAVNPKHKGYCTPMTKKTCTPARKALARTFKKKAKTGW